MIRGDYFYVKNKQQFIDRYFYDVGRIYVSYYTISEVGLAIQDCVQYTEKEVEKEYKKYVKNPDLWFSNYYY